MVGLKDCLEARRVSSTTRDLLDGKMPRTGSTSTEDIAQAKQFAFSVVQGRPTQCRYAYFRSNTRLGTAGAFIPKCERERRGYFLATIYLRCTSIRE